MRAVFLAVFLAAVCVEAQETEPSVFLEDVTFTAKPKAKPTPEYEGWVTAGPMVSNRAEETQATYIARLDVKARIRICEDEAWQPRFRARAQIGGYSQSAVNLADPETFNQFYADFGLSERVAPGLEVGFHGGFATNFDRSATTKPTIEGPAWWEVILALRASDERHWARFGAGQNQALRGTWRNSWAGSVDFGYQLGSTPLSVGGKRGAIKLALVGTAQRSFYTRGPLVLQMAAVAIISADR